MDRECPLTGNRCVCNADECQMAAGPAAPPASAHRGLAGSTAERMRQSWPAGAPPVTYRHSEIVIDVSPSIGRAGLLDAIAFLAAMRPDV